MCWTVRIRFAYYCGVSSLIPRYSPRQEGIEFQFWFFHSGTISKFVSRAVVNRTLSSSSHCATSPLIEVMMKYSAVDGREREEG